MIDQTQALRILEFEQWLNEVSGKRYHIRTEGGLHSLIEIEGIGKEKVIVKALTLTKIYAYLKRNINITLKEK